MDEMQTLINQNEDSSTKAVIDCYNYLKSLEELKDDEIVLLFVSDNIFDSERFVLTTNWLLEFVDKTHAIKHRINLSEIENVYFQEAGLFKLEGVKVKVSSSSEPVSFNNYGTKQLKSIERGILLLLGARTTKTNETKEKYVETPQKGENNDDIKSKLQKIKHYFDDGLITKEEYEQKKKELLSQL